MGQMVTDRCCTRSLDLVSALAHGPILLTAGALTRFLAILSISPKLFTTFMLQNFTNRLVKLD